MAYYGMPPVYRPPIPYPHVVYGPLPPINVLSSKCQLPDVKPPEVVPYIKGKASETPRVVDITDQCNASSDPMQMTAGKSVTSRSLDMCLASADRETRMNLEQQSLDIAEALDEVQLPQAKGQQLRQLKKDIESVQATQYQVLDRFQGFGQEVNKQNGYQVERHYQQVQQVQQKVHEQGQRVQMQIQQHGQDVQRQIQEQYKRLIEQTDTLSQKQQTEKVQRQYRDQSQKMQQQLERDFLKEAQRQTGEIQTLQQQLRNDFRKEVRQQTEEIHTLIQEGAQTDQVEGAKEQVKQFLQRGAEHLGQLEQEVQERLQQVGRQVQEQIQDKLQEAQQQFQQQIQEKLQQAGLECEQEIEQKIQQVEQQVERHFQQRFEERFKLHFEQHFEQHQKRSQQLLQQQSEQEALRHQAEVKTIMKQQKVQAKSIRRSQRLSYNAAKVKKK